VSLAQYNASGTNAECVTNNTENAWSPLSTWLRENGRQALNTETGGGNVDSCVGYLSQQVSYQAANSDGRYFQLSDGLSTSAKRAAIQSSSATLVGLQVLLQQTTSSARPPPTMALAGKIP
jgi:hypothetical protein